MPGLQWRGICILRKGENPNKKGKSIKKERICVKKEVLGMYKKLNAVRKNSKRITETQKWEEKFKKNIQNLFGIIHQVALSLMKNEQSKYFLLFGSGIRKRQIIK